MLTPDLVTPYILAGDTDEQFGREQRMLEVHGRPLLANLSLLVRAALHKTPTFVGDERDSPDLYRARWIPEAQKGTGALGGVVSALRDCATEWAMILAVDLPGLALADIWSLVDDEPGDAELLALGLENAVEPLAGLYRKDTLPIWEKALTTSRATLQNGLAHLRTKAIYPASGRQALLHLIDA